MRPLSGLLRIVAPYFSLHDFVTLYLLALAIAVSFAVLVVRNRLLLLLKSSDDLTDTSADQGHSLSATLLEVETAILALSDIQRRLRTNLLAEQFSVHQETSSVDKSQMTARKQTPAALGGSAALTGGSWRSPQRNQALRGDRAITRAR
jgi:hypothetical protein